MFFVVGGGLITQLCPTLFDPIDPVAHQALLSVGFPGKKTGVGCHFLLQRIFPTQGWNWGLLHVGRFFSDRATREAHGFHYLA